jgi:hypothetical protein
MKRNEKDVTIPVPSDGMEIAVPTSLDAGEKKAGGRAGRVLCVGFILGGPSHMLYIV